jgi:hypothetical protein
MTLRQIATRLNDEGIQTARGGEWSAVQVRRVMLAILMPPVDSAYEIGIAKLR